MRTFAIIYEIFAAKVHKIIETRNKLAPFFVVEASFFRKKEQARGESRGERSKGRGEMDVGERGEWKRIGRIGRDRKIGISDLIDSEGDNLLPTHT
jgi:hypothetical protein